jgi:signal transduction histidine kinase
MGPPPGRPGRERKRPERAVQEMISGPSAGTLRDGIGGGGAGGRGARIRHPRTQETGAVNPPRGDHVPEAGSWSSRPERTPSPGTTWVPAGFVLFVLFALLMGPLLLERPGTLPTLVLALLALGAAAVVIRVGRTHRLRAVAEAELRYAAFSLTEATEVDEVLRPIARLSARPGRGESSYVERLDRETDEVWVAASTGPGAPAVGIRVPYPGSLTEEAAADGEPEIVPDIGRLHRPMSRVLEAACGSCVALVIPLISDLEPEGALVILRPAGATFTEREIQQRRALGGLAALALRKVFLLERAQQQHDALQDLVKSRERLVRGFSHDVKNPLGAADGHAQLLIDGVLGELEPRQRESVQRIRNGIESALELIENLIELARGEAGQLALRTEEDHRGGRPRTRHQ